MTPEMLHRANNNAEKMGLSNVEFREGLAERLPVDAGWADLVISNGVLNLVPDKLGAYRQICRAPQPGDRIQIADICVDQPLSEEAKRDIEHGPAESLEPCRAPNGERNVRRLGTFGYPYQARKPG